MLFNSLAFAVFLPIVFCSYWALPQRVRWILMLAASYYFYMSWNVKYVVLIFFTTVISYFAALSIEKADSPIFKKWILTGTAFVCLGVLVFFKYFNFISESLVVALKAFSIQMNPILLNVILPVGISFYTFQTLSYVIDVYRGDSKAERHFGYYATFISFFPQLVAGPIERTNNLLPQIKSEHKFNYNQATYGLKLMAWGFFKKIVIADTLSQFVKLVYDSPREFTGFTLVLATIFFTIQIYCDFSGYSDIAIGTAKLFGINLMTNFKSPYFSQSIKEFWSRWHISLSSWFRDYVYIPLGGSRVGRIRKSINMLVTFLVSGLWHGASWTFVMWGGIHGLGQIIENALVPVEMRKKQSRGVVGGFRTLAVFIFSSFAWIFFVSNSIGEAFYVMGHLLEGISTPLIYLKTGMANVNLGMFRILLLIVFLVILAIFDYCSLKKDVIAEISNMNVVIRYLIYISILCCILLFKASEPAEFVYFQF